MKTKPQLSLSNWRRLFRRRRPHSPTLLLNMVAFNFTDGWSRTFARHQYGRSWA